MIQYILDFIKRDDTMKKYIIFVLLILLCLTAGCSEPASDAVILATPEPTATPIPTPEPPKYDASVLEETLTDMLDKYSGSWSVYVDVLTDDMRIEIKNEPMTAVSLIKLFNMVALYNEINEGNVEPSKLTDANLELMITESSNNSSNEIVKLIGGGDFFAGAKKVTELAHSMGCSDTQEEHMLYNTAVKTPGKNTVSMKDCGTILRKIYEKECISPEYDEQMLELLKKQKRKWKIPRYLPDDTVVANKTGENSKVEADVGIVFSPECDYVICIGVSDYGKEPAINIISDISKVVYDFLNATDDENADAKQTI